MQQIGLACWGMRELPLSEQVALCKKLHAFTMELDIANAAGGLSLDAGEEDLQNVRTLFEKAGLPLAWVATGNDFTLPDRRSLLRDADKVCRAIDICQRLQIAHLRIFAGFSPAKEVRGERWDGLIWALGFCAKHARRAGVQLCLELHGGVRPFMSGVEHFHSASTKWDMLCALVQQAPPDLAFLLDPANLWAVGEDPARYYDLIKGRIACMHVKDFCRQEDGSLKPVACGQGGLDWKVFLAHARYEGPAFIEYENPEDVEEGMRESIRYLKMVSPAPPDA